MARKFIFVFALAILTHPGQAQETDPNTGLGIGFNVSQFQKDFGIGINLTSPYFANSKIAIKASGNLMWHEHVKNLESTWSPYANVSLGIRGVAGVINHSIRLYGEGGVLALIPNSDFSSNDSEFGGYGLFGFEFFFRNANNYFIELGGVGTGAKANKVATNPIYSNGFMVNVGYRYVFQ